MAKANNDIPTLTQVVHAGDDEMLNHFNADELSKNNKVSSRTVENATDIENISIADLGLGDSLSFNLEDMPSITPEQITTSKLAKQDFSEPLQAGKKKSNTDTVDKKELKDKIDQAITEAMPGIEAQLKGKLYSKFGV